MTIYRTPARKSTSASFARQAPFDAFGPKAAHHLNDNEFVDRASDRPPKRLGEVVENVVAATARKAIRHWMKAAALAVTESEREEALAIATKISKAAGLDWPEDRGEAA